MKRMSEVFEFPAAVGGGRFGKDTIYGADGNGEWVATFETDEQAQHAAHAINHADALADALESLLKSTAGYSTWWASEQKMQLAHSQPIEVANEKGE